MVGIVVALLVGMVAAGSATFFGASQRQGVGAGGTLVNTTTTLSALKEDIAHAGLGFFGNSSYLCTNLNLSIGAANHSTVNFVPLQVARSGNSDQIDVVYANDVAGGANIFMKPGATLTSAPLQSFLPVSIGMAVMLVPQSPGTCTVRTITGNTPATSTTPQTLQFDASGSHNQVAFAAPQTYVDGDRVALIGTLSWLRYRVVGTDLVVQQMLGGASATLIRNVVSMRVRYLVSDPNDTTVTSEATPATAGFGTLVPAVLPRVRAVQIGVVTRSPQIERRDAAGNCTTTTTQPKAFPDDPALTGLPADWGCYRYRTTSITVPLRNVALGLRPDPV